VPTDQDDADREIREPENSTVEDWMGQSIQRDTDLAEELVEETGSEEEAEQRFDEEADGERIHDEGYPRPDDEDDSVDGPVGDPS
jgi:hypothetical protein